MKTLSHLIAVVLLCLATATSAQTVYRCGNSYSQQPCPGGNAVDTSDPRSPEQQKAAQQGAQHERRVADALEKQRVKEEEAAVRAAQQADQAQRAAAAKASRKPKPEKTGNQHAKNKIPAYKAQPAPKPKQEQK